MNLNNINTTLVFCGLENLPNLSKAEKTVVFGEWMSQLPNDNNAGTHMLFPSDFNLKSDIQTKNDIINQDKKVRQLYKDLLSRLGIILNDYHKENFSNRQWEIIIGHWLRHFLDVLMVRWVLVSASLGLEVSHIYILDTDQNGLCPQPKTRDDFSALSDSSKIWNQFILSSIVSAQIEKNENSHLKQSLETKTIDQLPKPKQKKNQIFYLRLKNRIKNYTKKIIQHISSIFNPTILLYSPSLSLIEMLKIAFKLKKIPYIYFLKDSSSISNDPLSEFSEKTDKNLSEGQVINNNVRDIFKDLGEYNDLFSKFVTNNIAQNIPKCYVEDWHSLKEKTKNLNLPKTTDLLYLGSGIITDECLRLYAAQQIDIGTKIIISQHGGVYGFTLIREKTEYVEQRIADQWISWGWKSKYSKNVVPGPALKGYKKFRKKRINNSLFVALPPVRFSPTRLNYTAP